MLEVLNDASGTLVAGAIMYAAVELRRIGNAVRDLDHRVSMLERWLQRERLSDDPGRPDDAGPAAGGGGGGTS